MNDEHLKAEKLALAKRKLREFESRRVQDTQPTFHQPDGRASSNGSACSDMLHVNGTAVESSYVDVRPNMTSSDQHNLAISSSSSFSNLDQKSLISTNEEKRLAFERDQAVNAFNSLKAQMEELHSHYSQLHEAYSKVCSSGVHSETEQQVFQLQSALALMVEEKAALQTELRNHREELGKLHKSLQELSSMQQNSPVDRSREDELKRMIAATTRELEEQRRLTATSQAELLSVQHEKSEAQARLKHLFKDKENLESSLKTVKQDLQMKEIYLKQLSAHQSPVPNQMSGDKEKELLEKLGGLESEVKRVRGERDVALIELESSRSDYEKYSKNLLDKTNGIEKELESTNQLLFVSQTRVKEQEDQISMLALELDKSRVVQTTQNHVTSANVGHSSEQQGPDVQALIEANIAKLQSKFDKKLEEERVKFGAALAEKDALLFEREQALAEVSLRHRHLEERFNESRSSESELLSLSEQLQNEKATVSRAVAQNKELKVMLLETEDRLVDITNRYAESQLAVQNMEHLISELKRQSENTESREVSETREQDESRRDSIADSVKVEEHNLVQHHSPEERVEGNDEQDNHSPADDSDNSVLSAPTERELELQRQLDRAQDELNEIRNDLRRSRSQNEEINQIMMQNAEDENQNSFHVELGQAVNRIHELSAENHVLREQNNSYSDTCKKLERLLESSGKDVSLVENNAESMAVDPQSSTPEPPKPTSFDVGTPEWACTELEKKFARTMLRNAELQEDMEKIEHINMQLQLENDTIADHVILYQHQRRLIRERLKAKDDQLADLEKERARVAAKCNELQQAMMEVLGETGVLNDHPDLKNGLKRVSRTYSHSTVDEEHGEEERACPSPHSDTSEIASIHIKEEAEVKEKTEKCLEEAIPLTNTNINVQRIFNIINDINTPYLSPTNEKLHCTQCIGDLQSV